VADVLERQATNNWPTTYDPDTQTGESIALDQMSVDDRIDRYVPGGLSSPLGLYMQTAYVNELGLDGDVQRALNLVYEMGFQDDPHIFSIYGESDQRYHALGGNDQIPQAIAARLPPQTIKLGWSLSALVQLSDGRFSLTFATPNGTRVVTADHVILTLPFSVLRGLSYHRAGFDALKVKTIQGLGYGTNAKLSMQMTQRLWNTDGPWGLSTGSCYSDLAFQNTWEASRGIPGATAVFVAYNGGSDGTALGGAASPWATDSDPTVRPYVRDTLKQLNKPFPGLGQLWSGGATLSTPWRDPHFKGSYACWKVGQYTTIAGYEPLRQGNCHFAGEHCTNDFQGFMEGGATTGKQAAREVLKDLNLV
jgi:monoamine oxidase